MKFGIKTNESFRNLMCAVFFLLLGAGILSAQSDAEQSRFRFVEPEQAKETEPGDAVVRVRTNVSGAEIYLDGMYYGCSDVVIHFPDSGRHHLRISKPGYESEFLTVNVKRGREYSYFVQLKKISGFIRIYGAPSGAVFYVDGGSPTSSTFIEAGAGRRRIRVHAFGYNDFYGDIFVRRYMTSDFNVSMTPAEFSLDDFAVSRGTFNPEYGGTIGNAEFSFYVTAASPEPARLLICNSEGNTVRTFNFEKFKTWRQSVVWDGMDDSGLPLPDGAYKATVSAGKYSYSISVSLDRSLVYNISGCSRTGTGIGSLPAAFGLTAGGYSVFSSAAPVFNYGTPGSGYDSVYTGLGFVKNFGEYAETGASVYFVAGEKYEDVPILFNVYMKIFNGFEISGGTVLRFGGLARYGYLTDAAFGIPGVDDGCGFGGGLMFGAETRLFYAGFSSEFTAGAIDGNLSVYNNVWRNGISLSFRPDQTSRINLWGALNSSFSELIPSGWLRAVDAGAEVVFMPGGGVIVVSFKGRGIFVTDGSGRFSAEIGLSYLF